MELTGNYNALDTTSPHSSSPSGVAKNQEPLNRESATLSQMLNRVRTPPAAPLRLPLEKSLSVGSGLALTLLQRKGGTVPSRYETISPYGQHSLIACKQTTEGFFYEKIMSYSRSFLNFWLKPSNWTAASAKEGISVQPPLASWVKIESNKMAALFCPSDDGRCARCVGSIGADLNGRLLAQMLFPEAVRGNELFGFSPAVMLKVASQGLSDLLATVATDTPLLPYLIFAQEQLKKSQEFLLANDSFALAQNNSQLQEVAEKMANAVHALEGGDILMIPLSWQNSSVSHSAYAIFRRDLNDVNFFEIFEINGYGSQVHNSGGLVGPFRDKTEIAHYYRVPSSVLFSNGPHGPIDSSFFSVLLTCSQNNFDAAVDRSHLYGGFWALFSPYQGALPPEFDGLFFHSQQTSNCAIHSLQSALMALFALVTPDPGQAMYLFRCCLFFLDLDIAHRQLTLVEKDGPLTMSDFHLLEDTKCYLANYRCKLQRYANGDDTDELLRQLTEEIAPQLIGRMKKIIASCGDRYQEPWAKELPPIVGPLHDPLPHQLARIRFQPHAEMININPDLASDRTQEIKFEKIVLLSRGVQTPEDLEAILACLKEWAFEPMEKEDGRKLPSFHPILMRAILLLPLPGEKLWDHLIGHEELPQLLVKLADFVQQSIVFQSSINAKDQFFLFHFLVAMQLKILLFESLKKKQKLGELLQDYSLNEEIFLHFFCFDHVCFQRGEDVDVWCRQYKYFLEHHSTEKTLGKYFSKTLDKYFSVCDEVSHIASHPEVQFWVKYLNTCFDDSQTAALQSCIKNITNVDSFDYNIFEDKVRQSLLFMMHKDAVCSLLPEELRSFLKISDLILGKFLLGHPIGDWTNELEGVLLQIKCQPVLPKKDRKIGLSQRLLQSAIREENAALLNGVLQPKEETIFSPLEASLSNCPAEMLDELCIHLDRYLYDNAGSPSSSLPIVNYKAFKGAFFKVVLSKDGPNFPLKNSDIAERIGIKTANLIRQARVSFCCQSKGLPTNSEALEFYLSVALPTRWLLLVEEHCKLKPEFFPTGFDYDVILKTLDELPEVQQFQGKLVPIKAFLLFDRLLSLSGNDEGAEKRYLVNLYSILFHLSAAHKEASVVTQLAPQLYLRFHSRTFFTDAVSLALDLLVKSNDNDLSEKIAADQGVTEYKWHPSPDCDFILKDAGNTLFSINLLTCQIRHGNKEYEINRHFALKDRLRVAIGLGYSAGRLNAIAKQFRLTSAFAQGRSPQVNDDGSAHLIGDDGESVDIWLMDMDQVNATRNLVKKFASYPNLDIDALAFGKILVVDGKEEYCLFSPYFEMATRDYNAFFPGHTACFILDRNVKQSQMMRCLTIVDENLRPKFEFDWQGNRLYEAGSQRQVVIALGNDRINNERDLFGSLGQHYYRVTEGSNRNWVIFPACLDGFGRPLKFRADNGKKWLLDSDPNWYLINKHFPLGAKSGILSLEKAGVNETRYIVPYRQILGRQDFSYRLQFYPPEKKCPKAQIFSQIYSRIDPLTGQEVVFARDLRSTLMAFYLMLESRNYESASQLLSEIAPYTGYDKELTRLFEYLHRNVWEIDATSSALLLKLDYLVLTSPYETPDLGVKEIFPLLHNYINGAKFVPSNYRLLPAEERFLLDRFKYYWTSQMAIRRSYIDKPSIAETDQIRYVGVSVVPDFKTTADIFALSNEDMKAFEELTPTQVVKDARSDQIIIQSRQAIEYFDENEVLDANARLRNLKYERTTNQGCPWIDVYEAICNAAPDSPNRKRDCLLALSELSAQPSPDYFWIVAIKVAYLSQPGEVFDLRKAFTTAAADRQKVLLDFRAHISAHHSVVESDHSPIPGFIAIPKLTKCSREDSDPIAEYLKLLSNGTTNMEKPVNPHVEIEKAETIDREVLQQNLENKKLIESIVTEMTSGPSASNPRQQKSPSDIISSIKNECDRLKISSEKKQKIDAEKIKSINENAQRLISQLLGTIVLLRETITQIANGNDFSDFDLQYEKFKDSGMVARIGFKKIINAYAAIFCFAEKNDNSSMVAGFNRMQIGIVNSLRKYNPFLSEKGVEKIIELMNLYVKQYNQLQQLERIKKLTDRILYLQREKSADRELDGLYVKLRREYETVSADESGKTSGLLDLSIGLRELIEFLNGGIRLYRSQIEATKQVIGWLNSDKNHGVLQIPMGMGKSQVLLPSWIYYATMVAGRLVRVCVDQSQILALEPELKNRLNTMMIKLYPLRFDNASDWMNEEKLQTVCAVIAGARRTRNCAFILTTMDLRQMLASYYILQYNAPTSKAYELLQKIVKEDFVDFVDEVQLSYDSRISFATALNGSNSKVSVDEISAIQLIFKIIWNDKTIADQLGVETGDCFNRFNEADWREEICPRIKKQAMNDPVDIGIVTNLLNNYIPKAFCKKVNIHYGESNDGRHCVPYRAFNEPSYGFFRDIHEECVLEAFYFLTQGVSFTRWRDFLDIVLQRVRYETEMTGLTIDEIQFGRRFLKIFGKSFSMFLSENPKETFNENPSKLEDEILQKMNSKGGGDPFEMKMLIWSEIAKHHTLSEKILEVKSAELPLLSRTVIAMSGTVENFDSLDAAMRSNFSNYSTASIEVLGRLAFEFRIKNSIAFFDKKNSSQEDWKVIFSDYWQTLRKRGLSENWRAFLDYGAFIQSDLAAFAQELAVFLREKMAGQLDAILFYDDRQRSFAFLDLRPQTQQNSFPVTAIGSLAADDLARYGLENFHRLFIIYDQQHCTGTNIPNLLPAACGLVTIEPKMTRTETLSQAIMRLRDYHFGQTVDLLIAAGGWERAAHGAPFSFDSLLKILAENERKVELETVVWSFEDKIQAVYRKYFRQLYAHIPQTSLESFRSEFFTAEAFELDGHQINPQEIIPNLTAKYKNKIMDVNSAIGRTYKELADRALEEIDAEEAFTLQKLEGSTPLSLSQRERGAVERAYETERESVHDRQSERLAQRSQNYEAVQEHMYQKGLREEPTLEIHTVNVKAKAKGGLVRAFNCFDIAELSGLEQLGSLFPKPGMRIQLTREFCLVFQGSMDPIPYSSPLAKCPFRFLGIFEDNRANEYKTMIVLSQKQGDFFDENFKELTFCFDLYDVSFLCLRRNIVTDSTASLISIGNDSFGSTERSAAFRLQIDLLSGNYRDIFKHKTLFTELLKFKDEQWKIVAQLIGKKTDRIIDPSFA